MFKIGKNLAGWNTVHHISNMVSSLNLSSPKELKTTLRAAPVYLLWGCSDAITRHRRLLSLIVPEVPHSTNTHFLSPTISCRSSFHLLIVWAHLQGRACPSDSTKCQVFRSPERPVVVHDDCTGLYRACWVSLLQASHCARHSRSLTVRETRVAQRGSQGNRDAYGWHLNLQEKQSMCLAVGI